QGRLTLYFDSQRRRHEEGQHDHLRGRLDATLVWHANHTHRGDFATSAWQRWPRGRWRQRATRALQHSGSHRHGRPFRQFAWLPEGSDARGHFLRRVDETHYADALEARPVGFVQLL